MVMDTSALVAILIDEPMAARLIECVENSEVAIAAPSVLEAQMVLDKVLGKETARLIAETLNRLGVQTIAFDADHARIAGEAFRQFGKGRHLASLNFGDCISYAVAKAADQSLLFVGSDFTKTDIKQALLDP